MRGLRWLATVAHLQPIQVVDRALRPARTRWAARARDEPARLVIGSPVLPLPLPNEGWRGDVFRAVGVEREVTRASRWRAADAPRLWAYRLHAFRWLHTLPRPVAAERIESWIRENPVGTRPGWEPYCLSLRIREWLEWLCGAGPAYPSARIVASLVQQVESLRRQVELHLLGNHLLENAVTLCWAGLRLATRRRSTWARQGEALLRRSLREQVLADGAHAERSPAYHALVAEALLRLSRVAHERDDATVEHLAGSAGRRLLATLGAFTHPDGDYALVNDTALDVAPRLALLQDRYGTGGTTSAHPRLRVLPAAGFYAWSGTADELLLFDVGPIGPDHQPGHGHAGCLAFEWSVGGRRLVTDSGVSTYELGASRRHQRSTPAHSTVTVDDRDQSEVWAAFRCGRRIRPRPAHHERRGATLVLRGGYVAEGRGAGRILHLRELAAGPRGLRIRDRIRARGRHEAVSRFHLAPGMTAETAGPDLLLRRGGRLVASVPGGATWEITRSSYHPRFGEDVERICLVRRVAFRDRYAEDVSLSPEFAS